MAKTYDELTAKAETIRTNQDPNSNTAELVGSALKELIARIVDDKTKADSEASDRADDITALLKDTAKLDKMVYEYNVSEHHSISGDSIFTLAQAVPLIPERHLGMKCTFRMKVDTTIPEPAMMSYIYLGSDTAETNFLDASKWQAVTPVILTESQFNALKAKLDNTLYYVIEEE
jgi:hypothetical protein